MTDTFDTREACSPRLVWMLTLAVAGPIVSVMRHVKLAPGACSTSVPGQPGVIVVVAMPAPGPVYEYVHVATPPCTIEVGPVRLESVSAVRVTVTDRLLLRAVPFNWPVSVTDDEVSAVTSGNVQAKLVPSKGVLIVPAEPQLPFASR